VLLAGAWLALAPVARTTRAPRKLALRHDGRTACVSGGADASVWRVVLPSCATAARLPELRSEARPMGLTPRCSRRSAVGEHGRGGRVAVVSVASVVDTQSLSVIGKVSTGRGLWGVVAEP
jgi:hypothetical protein